MQRDEDKKESKCAIPHRNQKSLKTPVLRCVRGYLVRRSHAWSASAHVTVSRNETAALKCEAHVPADDSLGYASDQPGLHLCDALQKPGDQRRLALLGSVDITARRGLGPKEDLADGTSFIADAFGRVAGVPGRGRA